MIVALVLIIITTALILIHRSRTKAALAYSSNLFKEDNVLLSKENQNNDNSNDDAKLQENSCSCNEENICCRSSSFSQTLSSASNDKSAFKPEEQIPIQLKILYATDGGTAKKLALEFYHITRDAMINSVIQNIAEYENDNLFDETCLFVFFLSSYPEGCLSEDGSWFQTWLYDTAFDFRVPRNALEKLNYAVFGLGDSSFGEDFLKGPKSIVEWLSKLGAKRIFKFGMFDSFTNGTFSFSNIFIYKYV